MFKFSLAPFLSFCFFAPTARYPNLMLHNNAGRRMLVLDGWELGIERGPSSRRVDRISIWSDRDILPEREPVSTITSDLLLDLHK